MGGSTQGGIIPSNASKSILIYSDEKSGAKYGYHDGWLAEEDALGPVFEYTAAGSTGDQKLTGNNKSVLVHRAAGRSLHLFTAVGTVPGTNTKTHRYVGPMTLDEEEPFTVRVATAAEHFGRKLIVFRMRPAGEIVREEQDVIPPAESTTATLVPADATSIAMIPTERSKTKSSRRSGSLTTTLQRREAELTEHYEDFLAHHAHEFGRFQIRAKGTTSTLLTDIYDRTSHLLHEAKGSTSREAIREAIGQLMDYRRHIDPPNPSLAILLPNRPNDDLVDLIDSVGIHLIYRDGDGYVGFPVNS